MDMVVIWRLLSQVVDQLNYIIGCLINHRIDNFEQLVFVH